MALDFAMKGVLLLLFVVAFIRVIPKESQSRSGLILLSVAALGKLIIVFAATDLTLPPHTIHGTIHAFASLVALFCGPLGELLLARVLFRHAVTMRPSPSVLVGLASVALVWSVLVIVTVVVAAQIGVWGLLERISIGLYLVWVLIVSLGLWNTPSLEGTPERRTLPHPLKEDLAKEDFGENP